MGIMQPLFITIFLVARAICLDQATLEFDLCFIVSADAESVLISIMAMQTCLHIMHDIQTLIKSSDEGWKKEMQR